MENVQEIIKVIGLGLAGTSLAFLVSFIIYAVQKDRKLTETIAKLRRDY